MAAALLASANQVDRAKRVVLRIANPVRRADALAAVAIAVASAGQTQVADRIARTIDLPELQVEALAAVVAALAPSGPLDQIEQVADDAEAAPRRSGLRAGVLRH